MMRSRLKAICFWPDLSREWIRRQEARIARGEFVDLSPRSFTNSLSAPALLDWESRLPVVLGPHDARKMDGVPDLSALLKGKLKLLSKKSTPANVQGSTSSDGGGASKERAPGLVDEGVGAEPSALIGREGATEDPVETDPSEAVPEDRPRKKKKKKKYIEAEPRPSDVEATLVDVATRGGISPETPLEKKRKVSTRESGSGSDPAASERSAPDPSTRKGSRSEGSIVKRGRIEFPDRVQFSYDEATPLILNPLRCAELTHQIRGGTKEMPQLEDLYFKNEYIDAASPRARFEELEGKLKSAGAAKKELARENTRGLDERPENENLEEVAEKDNLETGDTPVREEETENVGIEDPVLVSDSSSEGREDEEEEDDRVEEASLSQPVEEETTNEVGDRDVPPPPAVDSLVPVPTRVEDPTAAATEDSVGPPALGTSGEGDHVVVVRLDILSFC
ncbi:hypothetical protein HID58_087649, partial [Brassica napus]